MTRAPMPCTTANHTRTSTATTARSIRTLTPDHDRVEPNTTTTTMRWRTITSTFMKSGSRMTTTTRVKVDRPDRKMSRLVRQSGSGGLYEGLL